MIRLSICILNSLYYIIFLPLWKALFEKINNIKSKKKRNMPCLDRNSILWYINFVNNPKMWKVTGITYNVTLEAENYVPQPGIRKAGGCGATERSASCCMI